MQAHDREFIEALSIEEVPWTRLATPYYRAWEFSELLEAVTDEDQATAENAAQLLALNMESESVIWQPAPFAMVFLARVLGCAADSYLEEANKPDAALIGLILALYAPLLDAVEGIEPGDHPKPLPAFADMLKNENLLPEESAANADKAEDELVGEFYAEISEELFYSFFHYTWIILAESLAKDVSRLKNAPDKDIAEAAAIFINSPRYQTLQKITA